MANTNDKKMLELVLPCLASMENISVIDQYEGLGLTKEGKLFALINKGLVYFRSDSLGGKAYLHKGRPMPFFLFEDGVKLLTMKPNEQYELADILLHNATRSYWIASKIQKELESSSSEEQEA